jgi:hypothetical protein
MPRATISRRWTRHSRVIACRPSPATDALELSIPLGIFGMCTQIIAKVDVVAMFNSQLITFVGSTAITRTRPATQVATSVPSPPKPDRIWRNRIWRVTSSSGTCPSHNVTPFQTSDDFKSQGLTQASRSERYCAAVVSFLESRERSVPVSRDHPGRRVSVAVHTLPYRIGC